MQLDDELCLCFHITKRKILNHLRVHQPRVPSQMTECGGAGTGCGWCVPFLKRHFQDFQRQGGASVEADGLSPQDYARARGAYLRAGKGVAPPGATQPPPADDDDSPSAKPDASQ